MIKFGILISTKNRIEDLKFTLKSISNLIDRDDVECFVCDDGSTDGTSHFVATNYPNIQLTTNIVSKGYMYCRNMMLDVTSALYGISLDDDAHIITHNPLEHIEAYFTKKPQCGALAFRLFWGEKAPIKTESNDTPQQVRSFVGCGHVWNMQAWKSIPNYPEWFVFYGEEEFASYQLFKNNWEVHYLPQVLVHHRVNIKGRKRNKDYKTRLRRSLRSGWYLYFLFYPLKIIPKRFLYTLWIQFKTKVFKGDFKAFLAIMQAMGDIIINTPRIIKNSNRLSKREFKDYIKLPETKLYWTPKDL